MARSALWLPAYSLICGTSSEKQAGHTSAYSATLENKGWDTQGRAERGSTVLSRDPHTWHPRGVKGSGARGQATWTGKGSTGPPHGEMERQQDTLHHWPGYEVKGPVPLGHLVRPSN